MGYTIQDIQEQLSIVYEDIHSFVKLNNIRVGKNGVLSNKAYQAILNFYSKEEKQPGTENPVYVLNGNKIKVKQQPFFESTDKRISIFQDDAINFLKNLPPNSVDIIITDPAYSGMNQKLKLGRGRIIGEYKKAGTDGAKWFEEFHDNADNYRVFLQECFRVLKNNRHIYIMFDSYSLLTLAPVVRDIFEVKNVLCWDKANIGLGHYFRRRHEFILFASKGKRNLNSKNIPDVWKIKRVVKMQYPTQKPTEIFELMLKASAEKDFIVCDPFVGSGSSAIAAIKNRCKFLGCDISGKSVLTTQNRIQHFLEFKIDPYQKQSSISDDDIMIRLLRLHGHMK